jgi:hypothetical protein
VAEVAEVSGKDTTVSLQRWTASKNNLTYLIWPKLESEFKKNLNAPYAISC